MFALPDFMAMDDEQLQAALDDFRFNLAVSQAFTDRAVKEQRRRKQMRRLADGTAPAQPKVPKRKQH